MGDYIGFRVCTDFYNARVLCEVIQWNIHKFTKSRKQILPHIHQQFARLRRRQQAVTFSRAELSPLSVFLSFASQTCTLIWPKILFTFQSSLYFTRSRSRVGVDATLSISFCWRSYWPLSTVCVWVCVCVCVCVCMTRTFCDTDTDTFKSLCKNVGFGSNPGGSGFRN